MPTRNFGKTPTEALAKLKKKLPAKLREEFPKERPTELQGNLMNNSRLFFIGTSGELSGGMLEGLPGGTTRRNYEVTVEGILRSL